MEADQKPGKVALDRAQRGLERRLQGHPQHAELEVGDLHGFVLPGDG